MSSVGDGSSMTQIFLLKLKTLLRITMREADRVDGEVDTGLALQHRRPHGGAKADPMDGHFINAGVNHIQACFRRVTLGGHLVSDIVCRRVHPRQPLVLF